MPWRCLNHLVALLVLVPGACASAPPPGQKGVPAEAPAIETTREPEGTEAPPAAGTDTPPAAEAAAAASPVAAGQNVLESTRRSARSVTEWLARGVDSWFGPVPFDDGGKVTDGRFSVGFFKRQDLNTDIDIRFNAHLRLPNVERRAYLFVGRDVRRDVVRDTPESLLSQQRLLTGVPTERSFLAGLGLSVLDAIDFRIGLGGGAKPYAQARYDHTWTPAPDHLVDFRETLFWTNDDGFGSTTALSYEHVLSPTLVLRWLNAATITQQSRNFEYSNSLGTHKSLGEGRLLSFEAVFNGTGTETRGGGLSDFGLLARWEQPIYKTWMFGEIIGGHYWPRPDESSPRGRAWAVGGALKMHF